MTDTLTFAHVVRARAGDQRTALLVEDESWTWDDFVRESAERAALLTALVPKPDDRQVHVGVLMENVPDFVFWIGAGALAGAVVVGINATRSGSEIAQDIRHADVDLVVTESCLAHLLEGADHGIAAERILDIDQPAYAEMLARHRGAPLPATLPAPDDIALLLFSSGSTGAPKAVVVGQGRLGRLSDTLVERTRMRSDSVAYLCMPLFHGNAVMLNLATAMRVGATVAMTRKFSASRFGPDVHRYGVTFVNYVGRALSYVLSRPEDAQDRTQHARAGLRHRGLGGRRRPILRTVRVRRRGGLRLQRGRLPNRSHSREPVRLPRPPRGRCRRADHRRVHRHRVSTRRVRPRRPDAGPGCGRRDRRGRRRAQLRGLLQEPRRHGRPDPWQRLLLRRPRLSRRRRLHLLRRSLVGLAAGRLRELLGRPGRAGARAVPGCAGRAGVRGPGPAHRRPGDVRRSSSRPAPRSTRSPSGHSWPPNRR